MNSMKSGIVQIGQFSYFSNRPAGQGATGLVYQGFRNHDRMPVAVKTIKLAEINTAVKKHLLDCQVAALKTIRHQFVCQAFDVMKDQEFYFIPMEFCPNGTLRDYIKSKNKLPEREALAIFHKVLKGYCAIRAAGFIHRDLKSENILLRSNMDPAIIDFGYCENVMTQNQKLSYNVGSPAYMSPEAYNDSFYSEKSDVWALGVILHQMLTGTIPIMRTTDVNHYFKYLASMKTAEIIPGHQNPLCTQILLSALTVDPNSRPVADQLLQMMNQLEEMSPLRRRGNSTTENMLYARQSNSRSFNIPSLNFEGQYQGYQEPMSSPLRQMNRHHTQTQITQDYPSPVRKGSNTSITAEQSSPLNPQRTNMFGNLKKRITTPTFNLNLTPVRDREMNPQENTISPFKYEMSRSPLTAKINPEGQYGSHKIRRNSSSNSLSFNARFI